MKGEERGLIEQLEERLPEMATSSGEKGGEGEGREGRVIVRGERGGRCGEWCSESTANGEGGGCESTGQIAGHR